MFSKYHVGERLPSCILLSPPAPRAEEEFAGHDLDINPDGKAPVEQVGRKPLGRKAFGQLLGADEGSGDPLAVVKHLVCLGVVGLRVQGPEDNRHTHECTENRTRVGNLRSPRSEAESQGTCAGAARAADDSLRVAERREGDAPCFAQGLGVL